MLDGFFFDVSYEAMMMAIILAVILGLTGILFYAIMLHKMRGNAVFFFAFVLAPSVLEMWRLLTLGQFLIGLFVLIFFLGLLPRRKMYAWVVAHYEQVTRDMFFLPQKGGILFVTYLLIVQWGFAAFMTWRMNEVTQWW